MKIFQYVISAVVPAVGVKVGVFFGAKARRKYFLFLGLISKKGMQEIEDIEFRSSKLDEINAINVISSIDESGEVLQSQTHPFPLRILKNESTCEWDWDGLVNRYGNLNLNVRRGADYNSMKRASMFLKDYVKSMFEGKQTFYMANNDLPLSMDKDIKRPRFLKNSSVSLMGSPKIWIGGENTGAHLHRDNMDNIIQCLLGEKEILIAPPHHSKYLYTWEAHDVLHSSKFNALDPDYKKHPLAKKANILTVRIGPGELLFLPQGWWHQVKNVGPTLSVNYFYRFID